MKYAITYIGHNPLGTMDEEFAKLNPDIRQDIAPPDDSGDWRVVGTHVLQKPVVNPMTPERRDFMTVIWVIWERVVG